jgi:hypothetical protein
MRQFSNPKGAIYAQRRFVCRQWKIASAVGLVGGRGGNDEAIVGNHTSKIRILNDCSESAFWHSSRLPSADEKAAVFKGSPMSYYNEYCNIYFILLASSSMHTLLD